MPIDVIMPNLGAVAEESTLLKWLIHEGDQVEKGQPIFEAESDKATVEVEAPETGRMAKLIAQPGEVIQAGGIVAILLKPEEKDEVLVLEPEVAEEMEETQVVSSQEVETREKVTSDRPIASPVARKLAHSKSIDLRSVKGTGPDGRITKADVEDALSERTPAIDQPTSPPHDVALPLSAIRTTIAHRMAESAHTTAPVTLNVDAEASALIRMNEALRMQHPDLSQGISYDLLMAKIVAQGLRKHPQVNASLTENGIVQHKQINIGIAVDTERGLMVPVLTDVDRRDVFDLSRDLEDKIARAKGGKITADELQGGTFTVTNLGVYGVDTFTPLINLPECAILGVGRIKASPIVRDGVVVPGQMITP
ncbi:MAG: hypothetical protein GTO18_01610 [Anaerolineales bacterium]|nr:hypothetical protein [Anaerolineales bacterium]